MYTLKQSSQQDTYLEQIVFTVNKPKNCLKFDLRVFKFVFRTDELKQLTVKESLISKWDYFLLVNTCTPNNKIMMFVMSQ